MSKELVSRVRRESGELKDRKQRMGQFERPGGQQLNSRFSKNIERETDLLKHKKAASRVFSHR